MFYFGKQVAFATIRARKREIVKKTPIKDSIVDQLNTEKAGYFDPKSARAR